MSGKVRRSGFVAAQLADVQEPGVQLSAQPGGGLQAGLQQLRPHPAQGDLVDKMKLLKRSGYNQSHVSGSYRGVGDPRRVLRVANILARPHSQVECY